MTSPEIPPPPPHHGSDSAKGQATAGPGTATGTALAVLVAVVVAAIGCLTAVYLSSQPARAAVAWGSGAAGVVLCAAVAVAAHAVLTSRQLRAQLAAHAAEVAQREAAVAHFADSVVPSVVARLRAGGSAETALAEAPPVHSPAERSVLVTLATEVHKGETMRASALSACANAAGRVQALATSMAADLREMEHKHADEDVLGDLLHLDHRTAQAGRLADSIAVLTGARSGRRWAKPIVMESILRGAMGRIGGYQRVQLHSTSGAAVAGHAAEGVMHTLAELMDNAANFSPPTSEVHVYVEEVAAGIVITVEDGGLVMGEVALRRAERMVSPDAADTGLATLSGTRLGLAVVGRLARKHGLSVSFRPSAHGGTGVLVRIPRELVTEAPREQPADASPAAVPRDEERASVRGAAHERGGTEDPAGSEHAHTPAAGVQYGESGLPKRRRGQTLAAVARTQAAPEHTAPGASPSPSGAASSAPSSEGPATEGGTRSARPSGVRFGDFRRAVQGGSPAEDGPGTPERDSRTPEDANGPVENDSGPAENDSGPAENVNGPAGNGGGAPQKDTAASSASPASSLTRASSLPEDDTE